MHSGRIMIVSGREDVVAELEPIIRAGQHLVLSVADEAEAMAALNQGLVPDVVISDGPVPPAGDEALDYVGRFRALNRLGRHMLVVDADAPRSARTRTAGPDDATHPLPRPFRPETVRAEVEDAVARISRDLHSLRGEMCRQVDRLQQAIREAQREMVQALALTVGARDPYMRGHTERVADMARRVGRALGMTRDELELLEDASLLHEIGKVAVPVELLHKTERLTPAELAQIRAHATIGAEILRAVPSLRRIAAVVEHQGTDFYELPRQVDPRSPAFTAACVLRVVDAFDAMTSERSYRAPMGREYWEAHLRDHAGSRYHPDVVAAFFACGADQPTPRDPRPEGRIP